ncbi:hypothetical protein GCM10022409_44070 [Hymenobacter glaciei]|uniref:Lipoprotein n=1 Tax=Hymenobacter glaciei TaxID=877209 RepID=A0ABP7UTF1_9BACT
MALPLISRLATLASLGALLAGCCANNVCDCPNEAEADAIRIVFGQKFLATDLDTLLLVRYLRPDLKNPAAVLPKPEAVTLPRTAAQLAANEALLINNTAPFGQFGSARLDTFRYVVRYYPNGTRKASQVALFIDQIKLGGSFEGNGCCTCYTNSRKIALTRLAADSLKAVTYTDLRQVQALIVTKP